MVALLPPPDIAMPINTSLLLSRLLLSGPDPFVKMDNGSFRMVSIVKPVMLEQPVKQQPSSNNNEIGDIFLIDSVNLDDILLPTKNQCSFKEG